MTHLEHGFLSKTTLFVSDRIDAGHHHTRFHAMKDLDQSGWSQSRKLAASFVESRLSEIIMGALITFNVVLLVIEVDSNAHCLSMDLEVCHTPDGVATLNHALLGVYSVELAIRLFAFRSWFFCVAWNVLDSFVVATGILDVIMSHQYGGIPNLQMFRMFRLLKLLRTLRLLTFFPELYELVRGFAGALKAMLWGACLIGFMLGIWSLLLVEVVHPQNTIDHPDEWCQAAFSSVFKAMLFFFQTLVAGDSWGTCTIPIIRMNPTVSLVFVGALVSVQLGFTNLILAVIVDAASKAREKDHEHRLREKRKHEEAGLEHWRAMVENIDRDNSGSISLEELMAGFETNPEVMKCFALLDVDQNDLVSFFRLMDNDESGDLSYDEFFHCLRKAHSQDLRMSLMNVKLQISHIDHVLCKQVQNMNEVFKKLSACPAPQAPYKPRAPVDIDDVVDVSKVTQTHSGAQAPCKPRAPLDLDDRVDVSKVNSNGFAPKAELAQACSESLDRLSTKLEAALERHAQAQLEELSVHAQLLAQNTKLLEALLVSSSLNDGGVLPEEAPAGASTPRQRHRLTQAQSPPTDAVAATLHGIRQASWAAAGEGGSVPGSPRLHLRAGINSENFSV